MAITLQNMVDETADYVKAELTTTGSPPAYDADSQAIVDRIISGLNEAKDIIAKRKYHMHTFIGTSLEADGWLYSDDFSINVYRVISVKKELEKDVFGDEIPFRMEGNNIQCDAPEGEAVGVECWYIPNDMDDLTDTFPFPDAVSWRALCYYAAARFYQIRGGSSTTKREQKWTVWLQMWNDALDDMDDRKTTTRQVRNVYQI